LYCCSIFGRVAERQMLALLAYRPLHHLFPDRSEHAQLFLLYCAIVMTQLVSETSVLVHVRQIDLSAAIDKWLKTTYRSLYCTLCRLRNHSARFYVTNYDKPLHIFDFSCTVLCALMAPCWLLTAPFYKVLFSVRPIITRYRRKHRPRKRIGW